MPKIDRRAIYERDGGLCAFCGQPVPWGLLHLDHRHPRGLGGPTTPENLRVAHRRCNIAAGYAVRLERAHNDLPIYGPGPVRLPEDILSELREIARRKDRSANYVAVRVMRRGLEVLRAEGWTDAED